MHITEVEAAPLHLARNDDRRPGTDGIDVHMPVRPVKGCGLYFGDMHAQQGDGEIAGHTTDVSGTITSQIHIIKGLKLDGPVLFPNVEDLPFLAKPLSPKERAKAEEVVKEWGLAGLEDSLPISIVGTGPNLNAATDNGLERAAVLLDTTVPEIKNRATITGAVDT